MGRIKILKKENENRLDQTCEQPRTYKEHRLTPVTLSGVVVPWKRQFDDGANSNYKLICSSGVEYFFVPDEEWTGVLRSYCWEDVKVISLLNTTNLSLVPQKVFPKGPMGERGKVIELAKWMNRVDFKKIAQNLSDLVIMPVAIAAMAV